MLANPHLYLYSNFFFLIGHNGHEKQVVESTFGTKGEGKTRVHEIQAVGSKNQLEEPQRQCPTGQNVFPLRTRSTTLVPRVPCPWRRCREHLTWWVSFCKNPKVLCREQQWFLTRKVGEGAGPGELLGGGGSYHVVLIYALQPRVQEITESENPDMSEGG